METPEERIQTEEIDGIYNYYGGLNIAYYRGKYYWCIENYDTDLCDISHYKEIPKALYDSIKKLAPKH